LGFFISFILFFENKHSSCAGSLVSFFFFLLFFSFFFFLFFWEIGILHEKKKLKEKTERIKQEMTKGGPEKKETRKKVGSKREEGRTEK
jgi:hypothetical protein